MTPTPGDLSARHVIAEAIKLANGGSFNTPADVADWLRDELAALSALPAGGEPVACAECGGSGMDSDYDVVPRCCGRALSNGDCCGDPEPEQVPRPCRRCEGSATTPPADAHPDDGCLDCLRKERGGPADAAVGAQGDGWRPIESAPKDVDVLVYCPGAPLPHRVAMLCLRVNSGKTVWLDTNSDRLAFPPTHWQPLDRPTGPAQGDAAATPTDGGEG